MRFLLVGILLLSVATVHSASAQVDGADFDALGPGPYPFGGGSPRILSGPPDAAGRVAIVVAGGNPPGGAPIVPNVAGNYICINMQNPAPQPIPLIIEFDFTCDPDPQGICQVKYDFSMATWVDGSGIEVFVDPNGSYDNTDDVHFPSAVIPPGTVEGSNTENAGVCDSSAHTIAFRVFPGTFLYLDNMETVCQVGNPVGVESRPWGQIRQLYR